MDGHNYSENYSLELIKELWRKDMFSHLCSNTIGLNLIGTRNTYFRDLENFYKVLTPSIMEAEKFLHWPSVSRRPNKC
jgi:hypothetical protein